MLIEHILLFNLALLVAIASPGPALLLSIRTALSKGRMAGIRLGFGLATAASIWTLAALLGLEGIFRLFPWTYTIIKFVGACYLLYIAWQSWKNANNPLPGSGKSAKRDFLDGLLLNFSNPKAVLFAASLLVVIFPPNMTILESLTIVANHFCVEVICYSLIATVMGIAPMRQTYLNGKAWLERGAAVVMGALGLRLLFSR